LIALIDFRWLTDSLAAWFTDCIYLIDWLHWLHWLYWFIGLIYWFGWLAGCLVGWLVDLLNGCWLQLDWCKVLIDLLITLVGWLVDSLADWSIDWIELNWIELYLLDILYCWFKYIPLLVGSIGWLIGWLLDQLINIDWLDLIGLD